MSRVAGHRASFVRGSCWASLPALLAVVGCGADVYQGASTDILLRTASDAPIETGTSEGSRFVDQFTIGVNSVTIESCEGDRKHVESTPTRSGTYAVWSVIDAAAVDWQFAGVSPPPGAYCRVVVQCGPLDEDAVGLDDTSLVGVSMDLRAELRASDGDRRTVEGSSTVRFVLEQDLTDSPLEILEAGGVLELSLDVESALANTPALTEASEQLRVLAAELREGLAVAYVPPPRTP